jgi:eukaryotic-like serine/threonine-protein kinase
MNARLRWRLVEEIFHAVVEKPSEERSAYLAEVCGEDADLRREVESLLSHEGGAEGVLRSALSDAAHRLSLGQQNYIGSRIGPYNIVRQLGRGGMGTVYLAMRSDQHYLQTVAIKLVKSGMDSDEIAARFRNERQILANLSHPNIAVILDGGSTADGLPYMVMEYIEGQRITDFSKTRHLPLRERVLLFRSVCLAVHHAHQKLVIHRDIKPSNILVTRDGVPKLLDFGIAKLLVPELASSDLTTTVAANRLMTPDYASPEQILGETLATSSDIYSLGVVLFELLTESRPYSTAGLPPREIERIVSRETTTKPSELRDLPRRIKKELKGDLENIVLMAMRKEPARRYKSAEQFAEDLSRYLNGQPVIARPDTPAYRAAKFIRRHMAVVGAIAGLFVVLAGVITTAWQAQQADRARSAAQREADFLSSMFLASTPEEAADRVVTARDLLDRGAERVDRDLASAPEARAAMLETFGLAYRRLGIFDKALGFAERAWQVKKQLYGPDNIKTADSLNVLAMLYRSKGKSAEAEPLQRQILAIREKQLGASSEPVAEALDDLGSCLQNEDKNTEAEAVLRRSAAITRSLNIPELSNADRYLALVLERKGSLVETIQLMRESLDVSRGTWGAISRNSANLVQNLGGELRPIGGYVDAGTMARQSAEIRENGPHTPPAGCAPEWNREGAFGGVAGLSRASTSRLYPVGGVSGQSKATR